MIEHPFAYNYKGKRGHFTDVTLLYTSGYWDGPLSGLCEIDGHKLWFRTEKDTPEVWMTYYEPLEGFSDEENLDEDMVAEHDIIRYYRVYYLEDDVLEKEINHQLEWEANSNRVYGTNICKMSEEDRQNDNEFRKYIEKNKKEREKYHEWFNEQLHEHNVVGWFDFNDIKKSYRRLDKKCLDLGKKK